MTKFRFPHTASAIAQAAIQAAKDGGSKAVQLMDENNRAIEDAIKSVRGSVVIDTITVDPNDATAYTWTPGLGQVILHASASVSGVVEADGKVWIALGQPGFSQGMNGPGEVTSLLPAYTGTAGTSVTIAAVGNTSMGVIVAYETATGVDPVTFDLVLVSSVARS